MGGRFLEDPDVESALSGGGGAPPAFQEDPDIEAALAPPPRGNSTPMVEPDPNMGPYDGDPLQGLLEARDQDRLANNGLDPTERMAEAATGGVLPGGSASGSYFGNMARNAASGGVQGGLAAYRDTGDPWEGLKGAGRGAIMGAGLTGAGEAVGTGGRYVSGKIGELGDWLGGHADEARVLSTGKAANETEKLGAAGRQELAGDIEGEGLHGPLNWFNNTGAPDPMPGSFLPATPKTYARNAGTLADRGNTQMMGAEDSINALPQPPQVPIHGIINQNRARADQTAGLADPANAAASGFRNDLIDNLERDTIRPGGPTATMAPSGWNGHQYMQPGATVQLPSGELPWDRALQQRRNIDSNTNFAAQGPTEAWNNATRKQVGGELRGEIDTALDTPNVPPELAQDWRGGRDQTSLGLDVQEDAYRAMGSGGGQNQRIPMNPTEVAAMAAGPGVRFGGYSALAGVERGAQGVAQGASSMLGEHSDALTNVAQRGGGALGSIASQQPSVQDWLAQKGVSLENAPQQSRGPKLADAAQQLLKEQPQAFGQYQQQVQQAAQQGNTALNALIIKLGREEDWRTGPLLRMQHMTGEN